MLTYNHCNITPPECSPPLHKCTYTENSNDTSNIRCFMCMPYNRVHTVKSKQGDLFRFICYRNSLWLTDEHALRNACISTPRAHISRQPREIHVAITKTEQKPENRKYVREKTGPCMSERERDRETTSRST